MKHFKQQHHGDAEKIQAIHRNKLLASSFFCIRELTTPGLLDYRHGIFISTSIPQLSLINQKTIVYREITRDQKNEKYCNYVTASKKVRGKALKHQ